MQTYRIAALDDVPQIKALMSKAIDQLQRPSLDEPTIRASRSLMGLDTQPISDGTYFVVEENGCLAGCGGWSRRATLYGSDHAHGRDDNLLDPTSDPARFRAICTHPNFVRRGIGRLILRVSEAAAAAEGFTRGELAATLAGVPLYSACGWRELQRFFHGEHKDGQIPLVRMDKMLS